MQVQSSGEAARRDDGELAVVGGCGLKNTNERAIEGARRGSGRTKIN